MVKSSAVAHPKRDLFYRMLDETSLKETIAALIPVSFKDKLVERAKLPLYRLGLIHLARQLKRGGH